MMDPFNVVGNLHVQKEGTVTLEYAGGDAETELEFVERREASLIRGEKNSRSLWKYPNIVPPKDEKWYLVRLSKLLVADGLSPYRVAAWDAHIRAWQDAASSKSYSKFDVVQYVDPLLIR